jgi:hypothetical protein
MWVDSLSLPPSQPKHKLILNAYDIMAYVYFDQPYWTTICLDQSHHREQFPQLLRR